MALHGCKLLIADLWRLAWISQVSLCSSNKIDISNLPLQHSMAEVLTSILAFVLAPKHSYANGDSKTPKDTNLFHLIIDKPVAKPEF